MSTNKPAWITLCNGDMFEGHQGHWADCYYSNATRATILFDLTSEDCWLKKDWEHPTCGGDGTSFVFEVRDMTPEELEKYPEAIKFCAHLVTEYGEC